MKYTTLLSLMIIVLMAFSSCEKCIPDCDLVPAKIIRYDCDRVIFQLLTNTAIGDPDWQDVQTGQRYSNVVSYYNTCEIAKLTNGEKQTLYVNFIEPDMDPIVGDCYRCQAISQAPPQTKVHLKTISTSACEVAPRIGM